MITILVDNKYRLEFSSKGTALNWLNGCGYYPTELPYIFTKTSPTNHVKTLLIYLIDISEPTTESTIVEQYI
jgi:hypothetical protein